MLSGYVNSCRSEGSRQQTAEIPIHKQSSFRSVDWRFVQPTENQASASYLENSDEHDSSVAGIAFAAPLVGKLSVFPSLVFACSFLAVLVFFQT